MFRNDLLIAFRHLRKQSLFTLLNVTGLAAGIACCLLVYLFVTHERSFDRQHPLPERTYRVVERTRTPNGEEMGATTPYPLAEALREEFPELQVAGIHAQGDDHQLTLADGQKFEENGVVFAEPQLLDILSFDLIRGEGKTALAYADGVILAESLAQKLFGNADPMGQTFRYDNEVDLTVRGLMRDPADNMHLPVRMLIAREALSEKVLGFPTDRWGLRMAGFVYVILPEGTHPAAYTDRLAAFGKKYLPPNNAERHTFALQPLLTIRSDETYAGSNVGPTVSTTYLWFFSMVGLLVLAVAAINFVNLATAQGVRRAREVGVRKAIGAERLQLIRQFLTETAVMTVLASLSGLLLAELMLPLVNGFLEQPLTERLITSPRLLGFLALLTLLLTVLSGLYPAFVLSGYRPTAVLKGQRGSVTPGGLWLRRSLVIAQFAVSVALLAGMFIVGRQLRYFQNRDLGFRRDLIINLPLPQQQVSTQLAERLRRVPGVQAVSLGVGTPVSEMQFTTNLTPDPATPNERISIDVKTVDAEYPAMFDLQLAAGRWLTLSDEMQMQDTIPADGSVVPMVVNEALVKTLGLTPEAALGHRYVIGLYDYQGEIVGVTKDFHLSSLHNRITPMVMLNFPPFYLSAMVQLAPDRVPETLAQVQDVWSGLYPEYVYSYQFLDDHLATLYQREERIGKLFRFFAGVALLIACLGLIGLVAHTVSQRTKEIGVRKVLGASIADIVILLNREFTFLVLGSLLIGIPVAWWGMHQWLSGFAYRIPLNPLWFLLAGLTALVVAWLTVSFQSVRAARSNPVHSLKNE
ncbi:duplicated orphan permease [Catalinimonas alkaloidigena]|uniref:Duplicated orphan permease n=1 Tax=Catalinimonas alkaloidigena TaxID=1075417 RepID=A0A1G9UG01_9BACT|nr:ABC transporter permease [Catalinimonas alkaloidigena]SDM58753.1 duplicated orphan permease [Catalinimonas alkaloidigena]